MTYLDYMNKFNYSFGNNSIEMLDIFKRVAFDKKTLNDSANYSVLQAPTKEKLDVLAFQQYGNANLYHVLGLFNEIYDHTDLPQSNDDRVIVESDFRNSRSLFFKNLFDTKPIFGDLFVRVDPSIDDTDTPELEYELDTSQYAYVSEYDDFMRYVKTSSFSGLEDGTLVQQFRSTPTGNWKPVSGVLEIARSVEYGATPSKFFFNKQVEVSAYRELRESLRDSFRVDYDERTPADAYTTLDEINISLWLNGNFAGMNGVLRPLNLSCFPDGNISSDFCNNPDNIKGDIFFHNVAEKYFLVEPTEGVDLNDNVGNFISVGNGFDLCIRRAVTISSVSPAEDVGIANPADKLLSPYSLLNTFISGGDLSPFSFRTIQAQYEIDQQQKSVLKIPPTSVATSIDNEIKRMLQSGRSNEKSTIEGFRVIGGNVSDTIDGY